MPENDETPLTMHEKGVSGKPTAYDRLMSSPQWKAAKAKIDPETKQEFTDEERRNGADFIAETLWTKENTDELKKRLEGREPVYITMPSTTGQNILPDALAGLLQAEIGGSMIRGADIAKSIHTNAMKEIPAEQRPFVPREYFLLDPISLQKETTEKAVVIVEDVFSSGASAKAFCDTLKEAKIQVHTVAGLLGDSRLAAEPQLVNKLQKTLKHAGIEVVKAKDISAVLSRGQVAMLIDVVNNTRGKDEQERIANNLQGILDSRIARNLGQGFWRSKGEFTGTAREDNRNEDAGEGISIDSGRQSSGRSDKVQNENSHSRNSQLEEGGEKKTTNEVTEKRVTPDFQNERTTPMTATQTAENTTSNAARTFFDRLADNISRNIDNMQGLIPNQTLPFNPVTGKRYTAANILALASQNRPNSQWLSLAEVNRAGGHVNKGEKGTLIQYCKHTEKNADGQTVELDKPKLTYATVFNIDQTSLTDFNAKTPERSAITAEQAINGMGDRIVFDSAAPRYQRDNDTIHMPPPSSFPNQETFQKTAIEQMINRQETRYANEEPPTPGSPDAALRDMKIKIAASIVGDSLGIGHTADLSSAYGQQWKRIAKNHPTSITRVANQANTLAHTVISQIQQIAQGREHDMHDEHNTPRPEQAQPIPQRMNLSVPFAQKDAAKEAGCRWDKEMKTWYAPAGTDANAISQWRENRQIQATNPREELQNALLKFGIIEMGNHPIMDGKPHRFPVQGDQQHEQSGYYKVYGDGVPAGFIENHRTKEQSKWKASGYEVTPEMKETLARTAKDKYALRDEETTKRQQTTANRIEKTLSKMSPVTEKTPYMETKGIEVESGVYLTAPDKDGQQKMAVPLTDINGKVWSLATIGDDGQKSYAKDGKKHGSFHVVGGIDSLKQSDAVIMAEGYATAVTLKNTLQKPVVAAMDAGNLLPVAQEMRKAFPEKAIVICGDDDRKSLDNPKIGKNVGKEKAIEAANAVGGQAVFPIFPREADRSLSDFNDLANKTELKQEGVKRQVTPTITRAISFMKEMVSKVLIRESAQERTDREAQSAERQREAEEKKDIEKFLAKPEEQQPMRLQGASQQEMRGFYESLEGREYRAVENLYEQNLERGEDYADRQRDAYYETKEYHQETGRPEDVLNHVHKLDPRLAEDMAVDYERNGSDELREVKKPETQKLLESGAVQEEIRILREREKRGIDAESNIIGKNGNLKVTEQEAAYINYRLDNSYGFGDGDISKSQIMDEASFELSTKREYEATHPGTELKPGMSDTEKSEILENHRKDLVQKYGKDNLSKAGYSVGVNEIPRDKLGEYLFKTLPAIEKIQKDKDKIIEKHEERKQIVENSASMTKEDVDKAILQFAKKHGSAEAAITLKAADQKQAEAEIKKEWQTLSPEKRAETVKEFSQKFGPYCGSKLKKDVDVMEKTAQQEKAKEREKGKEQEKPKEQEKTKSKAKGMER